MKYELEPSNRDCPDELLLEDLRTVSARLGKSSITQAEYNYVGRFSPATLKNRFGTWNHALKLANLEVIKRNNIPRAELLADLKKVASKLGSDVLTVEAYKGSGRFSPSTISRAFGSWEKAISAAGLEVPSSWHPKIESELLLSNLASVWESIGRQPKQSDLRPPLSEFSVHVYKRRYGSWRKALEHFVEVANDGDLPQVELRTEPEETIPSVNISDRKPKTARDPSWKLRFLVNRRDRFACRACGRSPANEVSVVLHVDHIVPWSKGGETTIDNLQTLCERCNLGKSDLPMYESES